MENVNILGYFMKYGTKWLLIEKDGNYLKGIDITYLGKIHTLNISADNVDVLVLIENENEK